LKYHPSDLVQRAMCNYLVALGDTRLLSAICRGGHWEWEQWEGPDGDVEETGLKTGRDERSKGES
jgi:hypothetical protein